MAILELKSWSLRIFFKSQIVPFLTVNKYRTISKPYNEKRYERHSGGFISESSWLAKRDRPMTSAPVFAGAKIMDQPVTMDCGDLQIKTWNKFSDIDSLDSRLKEVLVNMGHDEMSSIQKHTFEILNRKLIDILGSAETGSGKTLAFLTPIMSRLTSSYPHEIMDEIKKTTVQTPQMLVVAPTRELVQQISAESRNLAQLTSFRTCDVIGGVNISPQIANIENGCHAVIATPGRLIDLLSRGVISLKHCSSLVLDEADRMLDMGFEPQIRQIVFQFDMPPNDARQTAMFSATFPTEVMKLARTLLQRNYGRVLVGNNAGSRDPTIPSSITQLFVLSDDSRIFTDLFTRLSATTKKTIVFCNTKRDVESVERFALKRQLNVVSLYGDLSQRQRSDQLDAFKKNRALILVATSVAARGIDVADVECVINFGVPTSADEYVHRVGRCGRMGRPGEAVTLTTSAQLSVGPIARDLAQILTKTGQKVPDFLQGVSPGAARTYKPRVRQEYERKRYVR